MNAIYLTSADDTIISGALFLLLLALFAIYIFRNV
jgi:hypothetical protein